MSSDHGSVTTLFRGVIYLATVMIVAVSIWMVVVGAPGTRHTPPGETYRVWQPVPLVAGSIPLIGAVAVGSGLYLHRRWVSWLGAVVLLVFSGITMFSIGPIYMPLVGLLLIALGVTQYLDQTDRMETV